MAPEIEKIATDDDRQASSDDSGHLAKTALLIAVRMVIPKTSSGPLSELIVAKLNKPNGLSLNPPKYASARLSVFFSSGEAYQQQFHSLLARLTRQSQIMAMCLLSSPKADS